MVEGRAGLSNMSISYGMTSPKFSTAVTDYMASVSNSIKNITIYPTIGLGASITVNGTAVTSGSASNSISLDEGINNIIVVLENRAYPTEIKTYTIVVTRASLPSEPTPQAGFMATGADGGILTNVSSTMKYSVDGGSIWYPISNNYMDIMGVTAENGIQIKQSGNGTSTKDSEVQTIAVTQAAAPAGIGKTDETSALDDGTITGMSSLMEYKKSGDTCYNAIFGTQVTGLAPGEYLVRIRAINDVLASPDIMVTIAASTQKTPRLISYADATVAKTYGDAKFINPLTQTTVNGTITYASDDTSVTTVYTASGEVTIVAVGDGSAIIIATAAETGTQADAPASYTVTVAKKALTLKADDKSMKKGDAVTTPRQPCLPSRMELLSAALTLPSQKEWWQTPQAIILPIQRVH